MPGQTQPDVNQAGSGIERRRHPRIRVDATGSAAELAGDAEGDRRQTDRRQGERRQGERRGLEDLRSNVSWTVAADQGRGTRSPRGRWRSRLKASQIVVLLVALGAGGVAAFLATNLAPQPEQPRVSEVVAEPTTRVLVASRDIGVGQRLSPASLTWQDWPKDGVRPDYITMAATPAAITDMSGTVARSEFLPGDPIRKQKLAQSADSFLPSLLEGGMRGVSVGITAESASGGFISPNDHVDVVLTRSSSQGESRVVSSRSDTILRNVRVLAIDARVGATSPSTAGEYLRADAFIGQVIATLALGPIDAEVIVNAAAIGKLSLLLRSAADLSDKGKGAQDGVNQAIRISSPFWSR